MKTVIGSSVGVFAKEYDMELSFTLKTNSGVVFTAATMPEFEADFYIENWETQKLTASFTDGVKVNCTITEAGKITAYIPGGTFSKGGKLFLAIKTHATSVNFADTTFDDYVLINTKLIVV